MPGEIKGKDCNNMDWMWSSLRGHALEAWRVHTAHVRDATQTSLREANRVCLLGWVETGTERRSLIVETISTVVELIGVAENDRRWPTADTSRTRAWGQEKRPNDQNSDSFRGGELNRF